MKTNGHTDRRISFSEKDLPLIYEKDSLPEGSPVYLQACYALSLFLPEVPLGNTNKENREELLLAPLPLLNLRQSGKGKRKMICLLFEDLLAGNTLFNKPAFRSIRELLRKASGGVAFPFVETIEIKERLSELKYKTGISLFLEFMEILDCLARSEYVCWQECPGIPRPDFSKPEYKRLYKVFNYSLQNYGNPVRIRDVAGVAGMTEDAFGRFFKKNTGMTYIDYLNRIRIHQAEKMLRETNDTIAGIAYSCGFGTLSNFRRIFREINGVAPGMMR